MSTLNVKVTHGNRTHDLQSRMVLVEPLSQGGALYFIWRMRCSIVYSDKVATLPVITANAVWKEFETTLKARLKHVTIKDKQ